MPADRPFVGREEELAALEAAIDRPEGQLILVVGREGQGKTALLEELNRRLAATEGAQTRFCLLYRLNRNDTSEAFLTRLMGDLLNIGGLTGRRLVLGAPGRRDQWQAFLEAMTPVGRLAASLLPEEHRPVRERFLEFLNAAARMLKDEQRLVLLFDPDEYLDESVEADWTSIARDLPEGTTIIFAQRSDDALAESTGLLRAENCHRIPDDLEHLPRQRSAELVEATWAITPGWQRVAASPPKEFADLLWEKYTGYPLALTMALDDLPPEPPSLEALLSAAKELPRDYRELLQRRYDQAVRGRPSAVRLLQGLAILARPASCARVAGLWPDEGVRQQDLLATSRETEVSRCVVIEDETLDLFHATLAEVVLKNTDQETRKALHRRAASLYESDLDKNKSDADALDQLPHHLYEGGDVQAFLKVAGRVGHEKFRLRLWRSWRRDLERTVNLLRRMAGEEPGPHRTRMAVALNNLATVLANMGEWAEARRAIAEAIEIKRELTPGESSAYGAGLAGSLTNLGSLLANLGEWVEARRVLEASASMWRDLGEAHARSLANALNNLGNVLHHLRDLQGAQRALEEALDIRRKLPLATPEAQHDVAMTLSNLGLVLVDTRDVEGARKALEEAVATKRTLAEAEPRAYRASLGVTLNNYGKVLIRTGDFAQARKPLEEATEILRASAELEPRAYRPDLGAALCNFGIVVRELGDLHSAQSALGEGLDIYRGLAGTEPQRFVDELQITIREGWVLLKRAGWEISSWPALQAALDTIEKLKKQGDGSASDSSSD